MATYVRGYPRFTEKEVRSTVDKLSVLAQGLCNSHIALCEKCKNSKVRCRVGTALNKVVEETAHAYYLLNNPKARKPKRTRYSR